VSKVVVYLGPARCGKTHRLLSQYRQVLRHSQPLFGRSLWLAPNAQTAAEIRGQLLAEGLDACLSPGVVTFHQWTAKVLADLPKTPRLLTAVGQRELLRRVVERASADNRLVFFADAARRGGFIDLLAGHIGELKQRGILPDTYAQAAPPRGDPQQHRELATLYAEYERELATHHLQDIEGAPWVARDALAEGLCRRFADWELIVVDGFTDFTPAQHQILRLLASRTKVLAISLPADDAAEGRTDLFAKVANTFDVLKSYHPRLEVQKLEPRPNAWPALDFLVQHIFSPPARIPSPPAEVLDTLDRLEIVEAAHAHDEIVQLARRVKHKLAVERASPGEIVVVFRSLTDVAPRIREVFDQFGIPYAMGAQPPLVTAPLVKTLLALLRLDDEDWPFRRVVSVITNNSITAFQSASRQAADWLVRDLQIAAGRAELLERVKHLASDAAAADQGERAERRAFKARAALPLLEQLAKALDSLPQTATATQWCDALSDFGASLGLVPFGLYGGGAAESDDSWKNSVITDTSAWSTIKAHLSALERFEGWLNRPPRQLSRRELIGTLVDVASHESLPRQIDDVGRVRVLAAHAARTVSAKHLFLAGMSEQAFPTPEPASRLATDADYRYWSRIANGGIVSPHFPPATRAQEEMLLFYEVMSRAENSLTISYPALDAKAQSLPPSPYVVEIERTLGVEGLKRVPRTGPQLSPVPLKTEHEIQSDAARSSATSDGIADACHGSIYPLGLYSVADWRVQAVADALNGNPHRLASIFACAQVKELARGIEAGVRIVHARARGESFGPAEGVLTSPAVTERLAARFGPQRTWSTSQWETYAMCPYRFFVEVVLGLEPLGDLVLETDYARRGSRLHDVLATFHREWVELRGSRTFASQEEETEAFVNHLEEVMRQRIPISHYSGIDAALIELDCRQIRKWARPHYDHHNDYHQACSEFGAVLTPQHFEFRFGRPRPGDECDPHSVDEPYLLNIEGEQFRVTGRIDRIDVGDSDGRKVFNIIDYKSGRKESLKQEHLESGEKLQLPIYVEAAQMILFQGEATPFMAGYWSMSAGFDAKGVLAKLPQDVERENYWQQVNQTTHRVVRGLVHAIRRGEFPVFSRDQDCTSRCDFHAICRVRQARSLKKTWPPASAVLEPTNAASTSDE
jgi:ATP-dependent helicase/DNAse subunit B